MNTAARDILFSLIIFENTRVLVFHQCVAIWIVIKTRYNVLFVVFK